MRNIRYIGTKPSETAYSDRTKIVWTPNKVDTVLDDDVAALMLRHPEFQDAGDAKGVSGVSDTDVPTPGVGGAGVSDGSKGDVVVSGGGTVWALDAAVLALINSKLSEDIATDITTAKTSFSNTDRGILLDAAAGDAPKTFTGAAMRQKPVVALGTSGTVNLDLDVLSGALGTIVATGNITLTTSNSAAGKHGELRIDANGATRTITYPAWNAFGAALVTSITSGQILRIAYECTGTTDSSIDATSALKV